MLNNIENEVINRGIIAILRSVPADAVSDMGEALILGGINLMEVAISSPEDLKKIEQLRKNISTRGYIGAGTVTSRELADRAFQSGAQFFITPHVIPEVCTYAVDNNIPFISGAYSPTEIALAGSLGSNIIKLFPASHLGPEYIRNLQGPYPGLKILVVGGINPGNLTEYMRAGAIGAGIGGSLTSLNWEKPCYSEVAAKAEQLLAIVSNSRMHAK